VTLNNIKLKQKENKMINKDIILNLTDIEISCLELVAGNFETQADIEKELYRIAELCKTLSNELRDRIQEDE
jgi:hypothetical protein